MASPLDDGMTFDKRLSAAWSDVSAPTVDKIAEHHCEECDEIAEYFGGQPWQQFASITELRYHSDALALFSNVAFHYYLPAFMIATLRDAVAADVIPDNIVYSFRCELGQAARGRLELFSQTQRAVVAEFLEMLYENGDFEDDEVLTVASLLRC